MNDLNDRHRQRLAHASEVAGEVLDLADAMNIDIASIGITYAGEVQVHPAGADQAPVLAAAIEDGPALSHYTGGTPFSTWTVRHRGVPVVVFGSYAGPEQVAS